jgi:FtsZ-interacting cell division protein ZipA
MTTDQVLILIGLTIVVVLLIVLLVAVRRRKARAFAALTPEERELHRAKGDHEKRVSELNGELKAQHKDSKKRTKHAEDRLHDAMKVGTERLDSLKGPDGTVTLTGLSLTTPTGEREITPQVSASVAMTGTPPAADGEQDTRRVKLSLTGPGLEEHVTFERSQEAEVRSLAAKTSSAASHIEVLNSQREDAIEAAEVAVAEANENATIEANNAQSRYDAAVAESLEKVRAAEDAVRLRGINPR